jgi:hypothetical protein
LAVWLYDNPSGPNDPLKASAYVADVYATRAAAWTARKCRYWCWRARLYEVANPLALPAAARGRTLTIKGIWFRDIYAVPTSELTYPPGQQPSPADPPFKVRAVEFLFP